MALQHRRLSQITMKTPSFRLRDDTSSTQVTQEALEHLTDLENGQLLETELAERGRQLIGSGDTKAILAILKNAHDDLALSTYLKYRRTEAEDTNFKDEQRRVAIAALDSELIERTAIMNGLTGNRDAMQSLLEMLDDASSETQQDSDEILLEELAVATRRLRALIFDTASDTSESFGASRHGGVANDAKREAKLAAHKLINLADKRIKSFVRIRPEQGDDINAVLQRTSKNEVTYTLAGAECHANVDYVFDEHVSQTDVFRAVEPMVLCTLGGFNATILAYGTTGSGKTHTVVGAKGDGLIPRSTSRIFEECKSRSADGFETTVTVAFLELYRDTLVDLLSKPIGAGQRADGKAAIVDVLETEDGGTKLVYACDRGKSTPLENLKGPWVDCKSAAAAMELHKRGCRARSVGHTDLNSHSSRSHSILMVRVRTEGPTGTTNGTLTLVDLAGSENVKQSNVEGDGLSEAQANNKSLAALGNVLSLLADRAKTRQGKRGGGAMKGYIPYRSNKLTLLLRQALGGNAHTLMITAVRKAEMFIAQTAVSLRFAERARSIANIAERNVEGSDRSQKRHKVDETLHEIAKQVQAKLDEGDTEAAEKIQLKAVRLSNREYGTMHEQTVQELGILGLITERQEKWDIAAGIHRRVLGICFTTLGKHHNDSIQSMRHLGSALDHSVEPSDLHQAETLVLAATALHEKSMKGMNAGDKAMQSMLRLREEVISHYSRRGLFDRAAEVSMQLDAILVPGTDASLANKAVLSGALLRSGDPEAAAEHAQDAVRVIETKKAHDDIALLPHLFNMTQVSASQGDLITAGKLTDRSIALAALRLGPETEQVGRLIKAKIDLQMKARRLTPSGAALILKVQSSVGNQAALHELSKADNPR